MSGSHRHLDLVIDGLRSSARRPADLPGPALALTDLRRLPSSEGALGTVRGQGSPRAVRD